MKKLLIISSFLAFMAISNFAKAQLIYVNGINVTACNYTIDICDASSNVLASLTVNAGTQNNTTPTPPTCMSLTGIDHINVYAPGCTPRIFGSGGSFSNQSLSACSGCGLNPIVLTVNAPTCGVGSLDLQFNFN